MCQFTADCQGVLFQGACSDCGAHPQADAPQVTDLDARRVRSDGLTARQYREEMEKLMAKAGR